MRLSLLQRKDETDSENDHDPGLDNVLNYEPHVYRQPHVHRQPLGGAKEFLLARLERYPGVSGEDGIWYDDEDDAYEAKDMNDYLEYLWDH